MNEKPIILVYVDGGIVQNVVGVGVGDIEVGVIDVDIEGTCAEVVETSAGDAVIYGGITALQEAEPHHVKDAEAVRTERSRCVWRASACNGEVGCGKTRWDTGCDNQFVTDNWGSGGTPHDNWGYCPACGRGICFDVVSC